jgi:phospholipase/carboxylesterase
MMVRELTFGRRAQVGEKATSLVVFLHGYGADGNDLLGLADPLGPHLPETVFLAPNAPEPCNGNPFGRQWFGIPWLDGTPESDAEQGLVNASADLNAWLDMRLAEERIRADRLCLVGFSQGAMMALHVAPRRAAEMAGVVAISGRLLKPEKIGVEAIVKPAVLLIHGDQDDVVPFTDMDKAGRALVGSGFETYGHVMKGTGHGIAQDGLQATLSFLAEKLDTPPRT